MFERIHYDPRNLGASSFSSLRNGFLVGQISLTPALRKKLQIHFNDLKLVFLNS